MKVLVMYYSFEGSTEYIAHEVARQLGADVQKVMPKKELRSKGFSKYIWGGRQAVMKVKPDINAVQKSPADYDLVIIGTPVWAGTYAPPLRTYLESTPIADKSVAIFYCHEGGPGKTVDHLKETFVNCDVVTATEFINPLKIDKIELDAQIDRFAACLKVGASNPA